MNSDSSKLKQWFPWIALAMFILWVASAALPSKPKDGFKVAEFGQLPVLLNGRIQPLDSVGRNALLSMLGKSTVRVKGATSLSPSEWLVEALSKPEIADTRKVFRLQHPELESMLSNEKVGLQYYSYNEVSSHLDAIEQQMRNLEKAEEGKEGAVKERTPFQKDLVHLYESLYLYQRIKNMIKPADSADFEAEIRDYQSAIGPGRRAAQEKAEENSPELQKISSYFHKYQQLASRAYARTIPPMPGQSADSWESAGGSLIASIQSDEINPAIVQYAKMLSAYSKNQPAEFNTALSDYQTMLKKNGLTAQVEKAWLEFGFNKFEPFYKSMVVYVAALFMACLFWINFSEPLRRGAFLLLAAGFVVHSIGLGLRMYLEARPPVTNLYSSAVFIGWGAVALGLILERAFKGGIGIAASSLIGFTTLIIAHHLSLSGDTMEMMRAVLDSNFWLGTHVVTVTAGYSSMFIAGILAIIYILRGFFTQGLNADTGKILTRMVYGIVCFSLFFSFAGTVLGGVWADRSWGRFWGWDPKENGALLIVLWNAIILHARWAGLIRDRGLMAMAVFGNVITSFSWFGVNMLGVGLHSYGFMDEAFNWLVLFIISQVVIIVIAMMPPRLWKSRALNPV